MIQIQSAVIKMKLDRKPQSQFVKIHGFKGRVLKAKKVYQGYEVEIHFEEDSVLDFILGLDSRIISEVRH